MTADDAHNMTMLAEYVRGRGPVRFGKATITAEMLDRVQTFAEIEKDRRALMPTTDEGAADAIR